MRVVHFVHRYPPALGGAESYVARLSDYLAARGDDVSVWTSTALDLNAMTGPGRSLPAGESFDGDVRVRRYEPLRFPGRRYLFKALSLVPHDNWKALTRPCNPICPAMWRDANRCDEPVDAVHAFAFPHSFPAACGLRLARRRRVPFFLTPFLHLGDPTDPHDRTRKQYSSAPLVRLLNRADLVFAQTPTEAEAIANLGVSKGRIVLQGLGVDPEECTGGNREGVRASWGVSWDEPVIGHLANLSIEKGSVELVKASLESGLRVVLAGPEMPNFRRYWDSLKDRGRVTKLGVLDDTQRRDFYAGIDAFALPSRTDSFGLVLLEAWANGKPVVAYYAGGPADLIRNGQDGYLVKCGDLNELGARLKRLVSDLSLRAHLGIAGRARLSNEFNWNDRLAVVRDALLHAQYREVDLAGCAKNLK